MKLKFITLLQAAALVVLTVFGAYAASNTPAPCPTLNAEQVCEL